MNLDRKGEWNKDWPVLCFLFFSFLFILFHQICICISLYVYVYIWACMSINILIILYFMYISKKKKKIHTKKEMSWKSQDFIELLPSARTPPEMNILSVLVKISWKTDIELYKNKYLVNDYGFFTGWASFQYGWRNYAIYIPFYSSSISIKMQETSKKDSILSKGNKTATF